MSVIFSINLERENEKVRTIVGGESSSIGAIIFYAKFITQKFPAFPLIILLISNSDIKYNIHTSPFIQRKALLSSFSEI